MKRKYKILLFQFRSAPCISRSFVWLLGHKRRQTVLSLSLFVLDGFLKLAIISPKGWGIKPDSSGGKREDPFVNPGGSYLPSNAGAYSSSLGWGSAVSFQQPLISSKVFSISFLTRLEMKSKCLPQRCCAHTQAYVSHLTLDLFCSDFHDWECVLTVSDSEGRTLHTFPHRCHCCCGFTPCSWSATCQLST